MVGIAPRLFFDITHATWEFYLSCIPGVSFVHRCVFHAGCGDHWGCICYLARLAKDSRTDFQGQDGLNGTISVRRPGAFFVYNSKDEA